jgi:hypothetical protein
VSDTPTPIQRFVDAARQCTVAKNWYAALTLSLTLPDICSALEDPGPGKVAKRYTDWCRRYLEPRFTTNVGTPPQKRVFLSAEDCFQARNSIVHEGSSEILASKRNDLDRFEFFSDGGHMNYVGGGTYNGNPQPNYLQLRVDLFCETIFTAVGEWENDVLSNVSIQQEMQKLLKINEPGTVIGGIMWG